jgi:hypothetical protein
MLRSLFLRLGLPVARPAHSLAYLRYQPGTPGCSVSYYTVCCEGAILSYHYGLAEAERVRDEINAHPTRSLDDRPCVGFGKPYSAR